MTKKVKTDAAPVSKYAAKKRAQAEANRLNSLKELENVVDDSNDSAEFQDDTTDESSKTDNAKTFKSKKSTNGIPTIANNFPKHVVEIALLIKNNAEIRRFTALGILNYLLQKGEINGDKRYVSFKWNKFAVKANGLMKEYSYTEPFFLNALVASFASFSASAQRTINDFCKKEMSVGIEKAVNEEDIKNIVNLNDEYQHDDKSSNVENITD